MGPDSRADRHQGRRRPHGPRQLPGSAPRAAAVGWQAWNRAANFAAQNNVELDDAMAWVDRSIGMNRNFANLRTKALILEKGQRGRSRKAARGCHGHRNRGGAEYVRLPAHRRGRSTRPSPSSTGTSRRTRSRGTPTTVWRRRTQRRATRRSGRVYTKALNMTTDPAQKTRITAAIDALKKS